MSPKRRCVPFLESSLERATVAVARATPEHLQINHAHQQEDGMTTFDAIIIGTGQAGPALARRMAGAGMRVAVIERGRFGGTCVNTGCTPTKTLVASAYAAHIARRGADYGFSVGGEVKVDMKRVKARKDGIVRPSTTGVERSMRNLKGGAVYQGQARFVGPHEVQVGSEVLGADKIFI